MHIALVTHPIEPKQKNFELKESEYSIAMSQLVVDSEVELVDLVNLLAESVGVYIPANTTLDTLPRNLEIALNQIKISRSKESDFDGSGSPSSKFEMEPIVMSKLSKEQLEALLKAGVTNPATGKPFTADDLADDKPPADPPSQKPSEKDVVLMSLQNAMQDDRRRGYRSRINTLVETGRVSKEVAEAKLYPLADNYQLQVRDNNIVTPEVETVIMSLESITPPQAKVPEGIPDDLIGHGYLSDLEDGDNEEEMDKIADAIMNDKEFV